MLFLVMLLLLSSFASAGFFGDMWDTITGNAISLRELIVGKAKTTATPTAIQKVIAQKNPNAYKPNNIP